jgi:hypothetical protein
LSAKASICLSGSVYQLNPAILLVEFRLFGLGALLVDDLFRVDSQVI